MTALSIQNQDELNRFKSLYQQLNRETITPELISSCYADDIVFQDPFHHVKGVGKLTEYFVSMYSNVEHISFNFTNCWHADDRSMLRWTMQFSHPRIRAGELVSVEGCSELQWHNGKIIRHQDFFDAGAMLYEHLPVLGWVIRKLKERML